MINTTLPKVIKVPVPERVTYVRFIIYNTPTDPAHKVQFWMGERPDHALGWLTMEKELDLTRANCLANGRIEYRPNSNKTTFGCSSCQLDGKGLAPILGNINAQKRFYEIYGDTLRQEWDAVSKKDWDFLIKEANRLQHFSEPTLQYFQAVLSLLRRQAVK